jgi:two-component system chemotaxis sensor kinase CheA
MDDSLQRQLINDLLVESFEGLDRFDHELLALEAGAAGKDTLNVIFRVIHTIKGTAGCLGLGRIQKVAHCGENLLDQVRSGRVPVSPGVIGALLNLSDALREQLRKLEASGSEPEIDHSALIALLDRLQADSADVGQPVAACVPAIPAIPPVETSSPSEGTPVPPAQPAAVADAFDGFGLFEDPAPVPQVAAEVPPVAPAAPALKPARTSAGTTPEPARVSEAPARSSAEDSAVRVDVALLDRLMNLVGELVLARNQILQRTSDGRDKGLVGAAQRLNSITTELQEGVMKTRMQPIGNVWGKFPRIVRDVSAELGKKVNLHMEGKETDLDRTIIEAIRDPLIHIIRNSIDHGIETPAVRSARGKTETGTLTLRAFHEGGQVIIEIVDDGAGINVEKVKAKAVRDGRITSEQSGKMTDREALNLIFLPGLSTAEKITNVSGRGVGMDVVKTNIERIGGSIDIQSEQGTGTVLRIKIPLTLAIIPALIVTANGERFAIPQVSLMELVRIGAAQSDRGIESLHGAPVYRLRDRLLPLVSLGRELRIASGGADRLADNVVVLRAEGRQFGLLVDEIHDTQEIVVKPLGKLFRNLNCYAGATIMGDGRVALILDTLGFAQRASVLSGVADEVAATVSEDRPEAVENREKLLVLEPSQGGRVAIPLAQVDRLEDVLRASIEVAGGRQVIQYRGGILPLVELSTLFPEFFAGATTGESVKVIVHSSHGRSIGLLVHGISDIAEETVVLHERGIRPGHRGAAIIQGNIVDLLDLDATMASSN